MVCTVQYKYTYKRHVTGIHQVFQERIPSVGQIPRVGRAVHPDTRHHVRRMLFGRAHDGQAVCGPRPGPQNVLFNHHRVALGTRFGRLLRRRHHTGFGLGNAITSSRLAVKGPSVVGAFDRVGGSIDAALRQRCESMRTNIVQNDPLVVVVPKRHVPLSQKFQRRRTIRI